jgi:hypothetical protein
VKKQNVPNGNSKEGNMMSKPKTVEEWLGIRKEAGLKIDPETAEVHWSYAQTLDPYGVDPDLPEEYQQVGRAYFARSPGSDIWVWFGDLPEEIRTALWKRAGKKLAFPSGLEELPF